MRNHRRSHRRSCNGKNRNRWIAAHRRDLSQSQSSPRHRIHLGPSPRRHFRHMLHPMYKTYPRQMPKVSFIPPRTTRSMDSNTTPPQNITQLDQPHYHSQYTPNPHRTTAINHNSITIHSSKSTTHIHHNPSSSTPTPHTRFLGHPRLSNGHTASTMKISHNCTIKIIKKKHPTRFTIPENSSSSSHFIQKNTLPTPSDSPFKLLSLSNPPHINSSVFT
jgi:hypothetical protein